MMTRYIQFGEEWVPIDENGVADGDIHKRLKESPPVEQQISVEDRMALLLDWRRTICSDCKAPMEMCPCR